jgi:cold shock CspA family protein
MEIFMSTFCHGVVKFFSNRGDFAGYGYINVSSEMSLPKEERTDIFFSSNDANAVLGSGDEVSFEMVDGKKGKQAVGIKLVKRNSKNPRTSKALPGHIAVVTVRKNNIPVLLNFIDDFLFEEVNRAHLDQNELKALSDLHRVLSVVSKRVGSKNKKSDLQQLTETEAQA